MDGMFTGCLRFNGRLGGWDVSRVVTMEAMFGQAENYTGEGIWSWDVSSVANFRYTFWGATAFHGDLSGWDVSSATDLSYTFAFASSFDSDIGCWDVSRVTAMSGILLNAGSFKQDLSRSRVRLHACRAIRKLFAAAA